MSKIVLSRSRGGEGAEIVVGYDTPFDSFFMTVEQQGEPTFADAFVDLRSLSEAAAALGIILHASVMDQLCDDRLAQSEALRDWSGEWARQIGPADPVVRVMERVIERLPDDAVLSRARTAA
jgi:hypothetical protein